MKKLFTTLLCWSALTALFAQPPCAAGESTVTVIIHTDNYGYETSWTLTGAADTVYAGAAPESYHSDTTYITEVCIPTGDCTTFHILDSYGDGIFPPNGYLLVVDGDTIATGNNFGDEDIAQFNCQPAQACDTAQPVTEGNYTTSFDDAWYAFTPDSVGIYSISTCGLSTCDTKIWIYDTCPGIPEEDNSSTIFFDDGTAGCDPQAMVMAFFSPDDTYYIRIGDNEDACPDSIDWELIYEGPISGCMDPGSCNFNPLATIDDGSCLPQGHPDCPAGPDLNLVEEDLVSSIYVDEIFSNDPCLIEEGCLRGYGTRDILRFTTKIENIGEDDYYIGEPSFDNTQFTWNNCHDHFHYDSYAEYILFDEEGTEIPIGFKNGFCVIDLGCTTGSPQYGCGNMGISAGCWDEYWSALECQWIDVTDIPDGSYVFVTRVNWLNAPDALGRVEMDALNNWGQVCILLDRSSGELEMTIDPDCPPYVDCAGTPYGNAQPDCNGECGGAALRGDLDGSGSQEMTDAASYVDLILGNDIEPTTCNDLNADTAITVYDAALLASCLNYGTNHIHTGEGLHDHCRFPAGLLNTSDTVALTILDANFEEGYIDIGIRNPSTRVYAYQFDLSGLTIAGVENLADPAEYPITPRASIDEGMVIGLSYQDSMIYKSPEFRPLVRIHYLNITDDFICIDQIVDIINQDYEQVVTVIEDGCVEYNVNSTRYLRNTIEVTVQPNPFGQQTLLRFRNPLNKAHSLELTDLNGRTLRTYTDLRSSEWIIERGDLTPGVYFYRLTGPDGAATGKVVVR